MAARTGATTPRGERYITDRSSGLELNPGADFTDHAIEIDFGAPQGLVARVNWSARVGYSSTYLSIVAKY